MKKVKKVLQNGYKYPQNRSTSFSINFSINFIALNLNLNFITKCGGFGCGGFGGGGSLLTNVRENSVSAKDGRKLPQDKGKKFIIVEYLLITTFKSWQIMFVVRVKNLNFNLNLNSLKGRGSNLYLFVFRIKKLKWFTKTFISFTE